jgi:uncharacterized cysteine cluster protein YcgN (CxxCxxCC family)
LSDSFWQHKTLDQMTEQEWELLCDGCGKCCLHKLQDEDTDVVYYTQVACRLLDLDTCQCSHYAQRLEHVPGCVNLRPEDVADFDWLPSTCAYRLVAEGKPLPQWHHLISGDRKQVHAQKQSVKGRVLAESAVTEEGFEEHIVHWVN